MFDKLSLFHVVVIVRLPRVCVLCFTGRVAAWCVDDPNNLSQLLYSENTMGNVVEYTPQPNPNSYPLLNSTVCLQIVIHIVWKIGVCVKDDIHTT